ncbi:hypothetical protein BACFIN_09194 [Bacteroides finegoldii DSM 17565]|jgi:hypothetical protein|nr:hypothetical protein BACFIN_09194 [Bacteroides finegoldii DSM 17565]
MYQKNTYNLCLIYFSVSSVVNKRILLTFTLSLYGNRLYFLTFADINHQQKEECLNIPF